MAEAPEITPAPPPVLKLSSLVASSFLPALIYEIGTGAITPVVVTTATDLGASTGMAAFTLALLGIGRVIGDVPASTIAERVGDRRSMIYAALAAMVGFILCLAAPSLPVLCLALTFIGMTSSTFYLARQAYLIEVAPPQLRARAQSTLAGSHRIGLFIGPFLGALAITLFGVRAAYGVAVLAAIVAAVLLFVVKDIEPPHGHRPSPPGGVNPTRLLVEYRRMFLTLGVTLLAMNACRQSRQTVLPLWAQHEGLSATQISIVFGIASAVDMSLFYPSGKVMDQWGRLAIALPAMATMGLGMLALPLTHSIAMVTIVAMIISFGNGIGSGIMQTIGADAAPVDGRRQFLGLWRLLGDTGQAVGPVLVSVVATAVTLATGIVAVGAVGLLSAAALAGLVPKYSPFATPASVRDHRRRAK